MSLARIHSPLSVALIRRLGDAGGPRADHVAEELDNLIAWARISPRCIRRSAATLNSVGAGASNLESFSLDANSLQTDGDYLSVYYAGFFAANDNNKSVNASFGGTAYETLGAIDLDGGGNTGWTIFVRIIRLSSTSVLVSSNLATQVLFGDSATPPVMNSGGTGGALIVRNRAITGLANLNSNATTMLVQGIGAANNDVTQNLSIMELCQQ